MTKSPGLLEVVRNKIRVKHYSIRTEKSTFTGLNHIYIIIQCNVRENWVPSRLKLFWPI